MTQFAMPNEIIVSAALQFSNGIVVSLPRPARHHDLFRLCSKLDQFDPPEAFQSTQAEQGFLTSCGRFMDRKDALALAHAREQIRTKHGNPEELYSEDIW